MLVPLLLTAGIFTALYNARGVADDLRPGWRYMIAFPRRTVFPSKTDAEIRSEVEERSVRGARVLRLTPEEVWLSVEFRGDEPGGHTETDLVDYWKSIGARGPYTLLFGSF